MKTVTMPALLGLLAGCTTMDAPREPTGPCRVDMSFQMRYVGAEFKMQLRDEIQYAANARIARILRHDDPVTKDLRPDRLNILLGEDGKIDALTCG